MRMQQIMTYKCLCIAFVSYFSVAAAITWNPHPKDGKAMYACVGDNVEIPWFFLAMGGEKVLNVNWIHTASSEEVVAVSSHGTFIPTPPFAGRVRRLASEGIVLENVTTADSGNYSVEAEISDSAGVHTEKRTIILDVFGGLPTQDGQLYATQLPEARQKQGSNQDWHAVLACGTFTHPDTQPPVTVHWITPAGDTRTSTLYEKGQFLYYLPNPVSSGSYTCKISSSSPVHNCLHSNSSHLGEATVSVDRLDARLSIMEAEQGSLTRMNKALLAELQPVLTGNHRLDEKLVALQREVELLKNDNAELRQQVVDLQLKQNISLGGQVAFNAWATMDQTVAPLNRLSFPHLLLNEGNGFDNSTGIFRAPRAGVYFFIFHTQAEDNSHQANAQIMAANKQICRAQVFSNFDEGICPAVVRLHKGEQVWVEPRGQQAMYYAQISTSFSGFLVHGEN